MFRNKSASAHAFSMVPKAEIPRSSFRMESTHKTSIDAGYLYPLYVDEVLPGDTFNMRATFFGRLATPIFPIMDNLFIDTFWFFVPNRLVWDNWQKFQGEQENPGDTVDYLVPEMFHGTGYPQGSIYDYMGLPTDNQVTGPDGISHISLSLRAYNLIWNEWFRDENLQDSVLVPKGDTPDATGTYNLLKRGKRHDYFTSCLPWTQKGTPVGLPLGQTAPVILTSQMNDVTGWPAFYLRNQADNSNVGSIQNLTMDSGGAIKNGGATGLSVGSIFLAPANLHADLSEATASTINALRLAFQVQRMLERDARGGTRYVEALQARWGVSPPDYRLQRPEYLGGNSTPISINPVTQTQASPSGSTDYDTPQGNLAAFGTLVQKNGFSQSFTEHGYILCLGAVRADLTYQQGTRRMWHRQSRASFYEPVFAFLGEQPVYNREIYYIGNSAQDNAVFGYQERWAEYRYRPNMVTGLMRSSATGTIDNWHLAQNFTSLPLLNEEFIEENPPLERVLAVGPEANGQQLILDCFFQCNAARPLPMYSVPGLIDHF